MIPLWVVLLRACSSLMISYGLNLTGLCRGTFHELRLTTRARHLMEYSPVPPYHPHIKRCTICSPATVQDGLLHGHVKSVPGDSAGPCIDFTGELLGISLGLYCFDKKLDERKLNYGLLNLIVPSYVIIDALTGRDLSSDRPIYFDPNFTDTDEQYELLDKMSLI